MRTWRRSIHSRECGARNATMDVFARLGLQNRIVHFPPVALVSSDFLLLFLSSLLLRRGSGTTDSSCTHHRPSPAAGNSSTSRGKQRRRCCTSFTYYLDANLVAARGEYRESQEICKHGKNAHYHAIKREGDIFFLRRNFSQTQGVFRRSESSRQVAFHRTIFSFGRNFSLNSLRAPSIKTLGSLSFCQKNIGFLDHFPPRVSERCIRALTWPAWRGDETKNDKTALMYQLEMQREKFCRLRIVYAPSQTFNRASL